MIILSTFSFFAALFIYSRIPYIGYDMIALLGLIDVPDRGEW